MTGFRFEALDTAGRLKKGVIEADSPRLARHQLRDRGLLPIDVQLLSERKKSGPSFLERWRGGLSASELALLTRQFAGLLGAGLTIEETLNALIEQAETQRIRDIVGAVRAEVIGGQSLSKSLGTQSIVFDSLYRTLVAAGEASGHLSEVMDALANYLEKRADLRTQVRLALIYPAVISVVAVIVVVGLLVWVMPQVVDVFTRQHQTLPLITRVMIALSEFVRHWGGLLLIGMGVFIWQIGRQWQRPITRRAMERVLYRLPVAGHWIRAVNASRLASTLAILVSAGVPLMGALEACHGVVESLLMKEALHQAMQDLRQGQSMARAFATSGYFPSVMVHLIASGERSGELSAMLMHVAHLQDKEVEERTTLFTKLLEPLLILGMGLMVLMIILSIMLPIFELNQIIR